MKAFVVVALLVASVAAQNMDLMKLKQGRGSFLKSSMVEDLLMKEKLNGHFMDTSSEYEQYPSWTRQQVTVIPIEEVIQTSLFRQFYNIPLFRQYWNQYPTVFHKYVESVLFQQFWTIPEFQQYFRNPIFFYKYIVPQVKVIATTLKHQQEGIFNIYNKYDNVDSTPFQKEMYPYGIYNTPMEHEGIFNTKTNTKYLLEKIYKNLVLQNKIGQIEETLTDVKMLPTGRVQEQTVGKIVDPYTGEEKMTVGDIRMVDEKIMPVQKSMINNIYQKMMMKDALKRMYMNKIFGKVMTPEYEGLFNKKFMTPEYETVYNKGIFTPEYESMYNTNKFMTPEYETIYNKGIFTPEYETLNKYPTKYMSPLVQRMMGLNKINQFETEKKIELLEKIMNEKMIQNIKTENLIKDTMTLPKMDEKFEHIPLTYTKPVIGSGINEFTKEKEIKY